MYITNDVPIEQMQYHGAFQRSRTPKTFPEVERISRQRKICKDYGVDTVMLRLRKPEHHFTFATVLNKASPMGKFILSTERGRYTFYFMSANGDRIAGSLPHITKSAAQNALNETRKCGQLIELYEKKSYDGKYYFDLRTQAGNILMRSEGFISLEKCNYTITIMLRETEFAEFTEAIMI